MSSAIDQARALIDQAQTALNAALSHLKAYSTSTGRVSGSKLDEKQLACYEVAYCEAEITAAKVMLGYSSNVAQAKNGEANRIEERLALQYSAEALQNVRGRFNARRADFGFTRQQLTATLDSDEVDAFINQYLSTESMQAVGKAVLENAGFTGEYMLDEEKEMMRDQFRSFATEVVMPLAEHIHTKDLDIPDDILKPLVDLGCFGLSIPMQYGGIQPDDNEDNLGMIVVTEELSRGSLGAAGSLITRPEIMARALLKGGTEEQKQYWLPKLAQAEPLNAVAVTEPNFGSDVAGMKLKATQVEGGWVLDGEKTWCTFAGKAGVLLTLARTNSDMSSGHKGLTMFLVEKPSTAGHAFAHEQTNGGTITGKAIPTIGYRGMHSFTVFFDNYFVPDSHVLGGAEGIGKGFYYTMAGFAGGRIQTAARATGVMQAAFERALDYSRERVVFGKAIGEYQLTLVKIARMAMLLQVSRQFTYHVARLMDEGKGQMEASLVKLYSCKSSEWLCREAMQIHGGMGYAEESSVSRYFIDSRVLSIFEGAEETLALKVIAKALVENAA
ncbi:MAG: acyl-CoA dehydrogenase [Pseudomonadales bacterium]|nr:acyl-CoA dehydrogenase [Pseudomonadales bacterium]MAQ25783.1 acyl-CoA dehydrogenase [Pseudomonadales bacterium]MBI28114.1 acyl-CoA dehydrogenase [Pseudomonadales bacterium]MEC8810996.1 acyl-CoA dehydrogenase family protein [Pseudomonadota bacterium]HAU16235.1 acyl-CoA dehydrogenase [Gammaproteobacteria bacterium]|tara:strand:- start:479 stop:2149 length:1671 start_codon:yes stop_codon:yes gene_type:complete